MIFMCSKCGTYFDMGTEATACPHDQTLHVKEPTTPAPAMPNCVRCGRIRMGDKDCSCGPNGEPTPAHIAAELTTLRQRLAEADERYDRLKDQYDMCRAGLDARNDFIIPGLKSKLAEAEAATLNIRDAMTAENLRVAAAAARWEGAARKLPEAREAFLWWYSVDKAFIEGLADKPALDAAMARLRTTLEITE